MTIYIVTSGSYSDYKIEAAFTDRSKAERFCELATDCEIEEFEADVLPDVPAGMKWFQVDIPTDGEISVKPCRFDFPSTNLKYYSPHHARDKATPSAKHTGRTGVDYKPILVKGMLTYCWAENETHAIKIGSERKARLIALNRWQEWEGPEVANAGEF